MSTYPLRKTHSGCNDGIRLLLASTRVPNDIFGGKKNSPSPLFVCTLCTLVMQCHPPPPQVPLSPLSDPMLSCLFFFFFFLGFRVGLATVQTVFLPYF